MAREPAAPTHMAVGHAPAATQLPGSEPAGGLVVESVAEAHHRFLQLWLSQPQGRGWPGRCVETPSALGPRATSGNSSSSSRGAQPAQGTSLPEAAQLEQLVSVQRPARAVEGVADGGVEPATRLAGQAGGSCWCLVQQQQQQQQEEEQQQGACSRREGVTARLETQGRGEGQCQGSGPLPGSPALATPSPPSPTHDVLTRPHPTLVSSTPSPAPDPAIPDPMPTAAAHLSAATPPTPDPAPAAHPPSQAPHPARHSPPTQAPPPTPSLNPHPTPPTTTQAAAHCHGPDMEGVAHAACAGPPQGADSSSRSLAEVASTLVARLRRTTSLPSSLLPSAPRLPSGPPPAPSTLQLFSIHSDNGPGGAGSAQGPLAPPPRLPVLPSCMLPHALLPPTGPLHPAALAPAKLYSNGHTGLTHNHPTLMACSPFPQAAAVHKVGESGSSSRQPHHALPPHPLLVKMSVAARVPEAHPRAGGAGAGAAAGAGAVQEAGPGSRPVVMPAAATLATSPPQLWQQQQQQQQQQLPNTGHASKRRMGALMGGRGVGPAGGPGSGSCSPPNLPLPGLGLAAACHTPQQQLLPSFLRDTQGESASSKCMAAAGGVSGSGRQGGGLSRAEGQRQGLRAGLGELLGEGLGTLLLSPAGEGGAGRGSWAGDDFCYSTPGQTLRQQHGMGKSMGHVKGGGASLPLDMELEGGWAAGPGQQQKMSGRKRAAPPRRSPLG
ncbi:hypothetical protein V8C86DRAFT_3165019 [Haematococcus lacustris]